MKNKKPSYDELKKKLAESEKLIARLQESGISSQKSDGDTEFDKAKRGTKELAEAYIASEQNFRNSMDASPLGIRVVTKDGELIYTNKAMLEVCGYKTMEELAAVPRSELYTPESYAAHQERKQRRNSKQYVPAEYELSIKRADGKIRNLRVFRREVMWGGEQQFMAMYEDITERKQAEDALKESEEKFHSIVEHGNDGIAFIENGVVQYCNSKLLEMGGYTAEEVTGKAFLDYVSPEHREMVLERYRKRIAGEKVPERYELNLLAKGGSKIFTEISASLVSYRENTVDIVIVRDITERKQVEEALRYQANLIQNITDAVVSSDMDFKVISWNKGAEEIYGWREAEVIGENIIDVLKPEVQPGSSVEQVRESLKKNGYWKGEVIHERRDGKKLNILAAASVMRDSQGNPRGAVSVFKDITELKQAEDSLKESEERYRTLFESAAEGILIADSEAKSFKYANPAICAMFGYSHEELIKMSVSDIHPKASLEYVLTEFAAIARGEKTSALDIPCLKKDGTIFYADIAGTKDIIDGKLCGIGFFSDITERKQAEEALRESETKFRTLFETMAQGVIYHDMEGRVISANPAAGSILGLPLKEMLGKTSLDPRRKRLRENGSEFASKDHPSMVALRTGKPINDVAMAVYNPVEKDYRWIIINAIPEFREGKKVPYRVYTTFTDITERKRMEEVVRESEERYHLIFEKSKDAILLTSPDGKILAANSAACIMFQRSEEEICRIGRNGIIDTTDPRLAPALEKRHVTGEFIGELTFIRADGTKFPADMSSKIFHDKDGNERTSMIIRDITERKGMEEALRDSEERFRQIFQQGPLGIVLSNLDYRFTIMNTQYCKMFGYTEKELRSMSFKDISSPEDVQIDAPNLQKLVKGKLAYYSREKRYIKKNKEVMWGSLTATLLKDKTGKPLGFLAMVEDITERKQAEEALANEAIRRRILIEQSSDGIVVLDQDGKVYEANQRFAEMLGYSAEELRQLYVFDWEFQFPREQVVEMIRTVDEKGDHFETKHRRKGGTTYDVEISTNGVTFAGQKLIFCVCRDITERKRAEEALKRSEESLLAAQRVAKIGSYEYDPVTGISIWSSEMFNLVGRDPALGPMSVPEFMQLMHPEDRTAMQSMLEGCARDGVSGAIEFRGDPASGEIRYFIGNVQAASDSKGRITKLFGTIQDITERKQAEEALIASEIRYRRLFESAKDGILILNAETGQIVDVNPFLFNLIGFSFEELMGRKLWEIGLFKDIAASKEAFKELQDKGYVRYEDLPLETKDGKKRDVEFVSNVYQVSNMRVVQCNVRDITERKRAQDTIKESEERFATAFRNSPILMAISTLKDGRFIETNDAFCRAMGYRHEELLGHSSLELNLWYDPGERMATLEKMKGREELSNLEVRFRTKSGETRTAEMSMVKIILRNEPCLLIIAMDITERKLLEEELEREYEENKLIIDSSPVLIFYKDREGRFLRVNNAFAVALDMPEDKFLGRTVFDLYSADIAQSMTNDDNEVFESGISKLSIIEQYESARGIRWVQTDKVPILDKSGKTIGLVGFAQDITERKQAEEAIRESEEKFNKAFHASPNLMAVITLDEGRIIDVNEAYSTITGYKREELWGNVALELNLWANPEQRKDFYQKINKDGRLDNMEILLRTKAGEIRAFLFSAEKITLRGIPCLVTVALDITERKLAEERINHLNLTLQSVRNVNQLITREKDRDKLLKGVCDTLVKGRSFFTAWIVLLNESKEVITHAASGIRGDFTPLLSRIKQEETLPCIQKALKKSGVVITENPHTMCADCPAIANSTDFGSMTVRLEYEGAIYGILCSSLPKSILTDKSEAELFQEVATDIAFALHNMEMESEYTRLEQERLRVAKLESIGTLAGGIAHDFNNLLTGIMGNIGLVKTYIAPSDATYEMLNEAENAAARARDLTQQLLTFARGGKPVKRLTSVAGVIKESAEFALRGSKVKLELSLPDNLWPIEADEGQINQVINNLAINADEAMPRGGTLKIRAENLVYKKSAALPLQSGNYVRVDIEDTGIGISPENLQRIFEPYFTTKQRGSGLGLTTAYSIVRNHNGIILADSILNRGSTFRIYLPATKKILKGGKKVTVESAGQAGGKVLVMDDEEIIRKMLKNMLSLAGYTVELAADGDEAITKYQQARAAGDPFNAVIMDLTIPGGMGGKEAVKKLLEIDPKATVIVSSGYATDAIMSEYKKYGFKSVIAKPYSVRQLQDTLSGLLTKKKR